MKPRARLLKTTTFTGGSRWARRRKSPISMGKPQAPESERRGGCGKGYGVTRGYFFFFSSRRRHTRWTGDWSSDVCSSDLGGLCNRAGADRGGPAVDPRNDLEVDSSARAWLRVQSRDQLHRDGHRHACRALPRLRADLAFETGAQECALSHALLPQRSVARAALLLHVPDPVRDDALRCEDPDSRLDEGHAWPRAPRHGERL